MRLEAETRSALAPAGAAWMGALLLVLAGLPGCGYTMGHRVPPGVRTISVPMFENTTFPLRREVEFEISSAFRQEIQARTNLRIIDENSSPDLVIRGRILEFRERVIAEGRQNVKTESNVVSVVELRIENYLQGTLRVEKVSDVEPFSIEQGETFATGRRRAIKNLAEKLVVAIEDWGAGDSDPDESSGIPTASFGERGDGDPGATAVEGADAAVPAAGRGATIHPRRGMDGVGSSRSLERT